MAEPFIAEIRIFAGNFAPRGWAMCNGQLLPISQNTALFSIVGTIYGGDGRIDFALPNLQDCVPMHPGHGSGLTPRQLGQRGGTEDVTLSQGQLPSHTHDAWGTTEPAIQSNPTESLLATGAKARYASPDSLTEMAQSALATAGNGQPHNNLQPFLAVNFIIALTGLFPSRS